MNEKQHGQTTPQFTTEVHRHAKFLGIDPTDYNLRKVEKALDLADTGDIVPVQSCEIPFGVRAFYVPTSDRKTPYIVKLFDGKHSTCTCPDPYMHCKHTLAVRIRDIREIEPGWDNFNMNGDEQMVRDWMEMLKPAGGGR